MPNEPIVSMQKLIIHWTIVRLGYIVTMGQLVIDKLNRFQWQHKMMS